MTNTVVLGCHHLPSEDPAVEHVDAECRVHESGERPHVGEIRDPPLVRPVRGAPFPVDQIRVSWCPLVALRVDVRCISPKRPCQNGTVARNRKKQYVDPGWPATAAGKPAVTELSSSRAGGLSPFGEDAEFPVPAESLPYTHPHTVINR